MAQGVQFQELRENSIWNAALSRSEYKRVVSWNFLRWLPAIPLVVLLIFGSGSVALVQASPAPSDTRSLISADYQPWEFTVIKPIVEEIIEEIQKDQELYPEVFEEPVEPEVAPGSFWDPPTPVESSPTPTRQATATEIAIPVSPTVTETLTATVGPSPSPSPSPTLTSTPSGPPAPIPPGAPPANSYWFYEDTSPLSHMMYTTLASGGYSSGGTASFYSPAFVSGQSLQSGTSTINFYAWNPSPIAAVFSVELIGGTTLLGSGSFALPAETYDAYFFSASFATGSHNFSDGERLEVSLSFASPAELYWDGAYNYSGVILPAMAMTPTPTASPTSSASPTPTSTAAPTDTPTNTPVPPTSTPTFTATNTAVPPTNTPTNTPVPPTGTPTNTPVPPTSTPTNTPVPPTSTPTSTPVPPTNTPTNTLVPPTNTPTNTPVPPTATPTNTPVPPTSTPTNTPVPPTPTPTNTPVPPTNTPTNTPVPPTNTPTNTPVPPTNTPTNTPAPTSTPGGSPTIDATSTATTTGSSITFSHTTSGTNRLMLVGVSFGLVSSETVDTITYNSVSLNFEGARNSPSTQARVEIWSLVAPDTGTHDVVVDFTAAAGDGAMIGVMTFENVNQLDPLRAFASAAGNTGGASVNVGSGAGELVFAVVAVDDGTNYNLAPGGSQNEVWDLHLIEGNGGGSTQPGAGPTVNASWSWPGTDDWAVAGISIKPN